MAKVNLHHVTRFYLLCCLLFIILFCVADIIYWLSQLVTSALPNGRNYSLDTRFEFLFILIGKSTTALLMGQSQCILKSWYTSGGRE